VYGCRTRKRLIYSLGQQTTVFQAEVYAITACAVENINTGFKALNKYHSNSKLVSSCLQSVMELADHNRVQLIWVPGHKGIEGNEIANQLAKKGSRQPLIGHKTAYSTSERAAKWATRDWMNRKHQEL
jgi:ribonuclease HI